MLIISRRIKCLQKRKLEYQEGFFKGREGRLWLWTATASALFLILIFYRYYSFYSGLDESVSFKPGTLSEDDVLLIAHELGPLWKKVGLVLKVPKAVIDQIEADESKVSDKCCSKCSCVVCIVVMG